MKTIFPKILFNSYKGQNGRMCIIGGSLDYTSAPFYSAISQLKGGADLAHIICTKQAAIPIKSYSPEIIVHPYINALNEQDNKYYDEQQKIGDSLNKITDWVSAFTSFVIGPGLGRDVWIQEILGEVFETIIKKQIIVLDADGMIDVVTNGKKAYVLLEQSSFKRCGGIGDILCGLTGLYCYLAFRQSIEKSVSLKQEDVILLGCVYSGCITRKASQMAFAKYNFSLTAPNIIEFIGQCHVTVQDFHILI
ncbi:hypothetical protein IMG5_026410 [Ichthyophthirius multifiliis]|uniref:ATP-dependent (S)-NAD(P)H-hydrate dehydratase n=1 Tax=Ichthyophthirius multifiliis TaxID=5932 RepID=G0QL68_ICHMU|nr:hypothetical protein IMG5_026410 [Ichthyophthirius multifiliis]EGR34035.1 hypothetical protein IMG5_026410 [Ichthyophthirius multifiliis]|eukprot:XP_004039339.1 hypothetical protein IMG5_026410 [Ichthyophthirius multifiliis]